MREYLENLERKYGRILEAHLYFSARNIQLKEMVDQQMGLLKKIEKVASWMERRIVVLETNNKSLRIELAQKVK